MKKNKLTKTRQGANHLNCKHKVIKLIGCFYFRNQTFSFILATIALLQIATLTPLMVRGHGS